MKKVLFSIVTFVTLSASAQTPAANPTNGQNSGNLSNVDGNGYTFAFKGTAADNCVGTADSPATFPVTANSGLLDFYGSPQSYYQIASVGGGSLTYTIKAGTPAGFASNLHLRFLDAACGYNSTTVDLTDVNQGYQIDYTSSDTLQALIFVNGGMPGGAVSGSTTYGDKAVSATTFVRGTGIIRSTFQDSTSAGESAHLETSGAFTIQLLKSPTKDITLTFFKIVFGLFADAVVDYTYTKSNSAVYPNPISSNEELTVSGLTGSLSMKLMNSTGNTVASSETAKLQLNNVNAGLYFLEVNNNGTIKTEKVMVK